MAQTIAEKLAANREWWAERQAQTQAALTKKTVAETEKQLIKYYASSQNKVIGQFNDTYLHILSSIKDGREPTPADLYKLDTYWKMQAQLKDELSNLGYKQAELLSNQFMQEWEHIYKGMAIKDDLFFSEIDTQMAKQVINEVWCADGLTWSERIWKNTDLLQQTLNDNLIDCVLTGRPPGDLKKMLMETFNASYNRADSLVRTELAHIQTKAAQQRYIDEGVEWVEVWADYDERRCDVCGELHETRHKATGKLPIPAHPRCRCCIIPVIE